MRDSTARQYTADWLQHGRPQQMYDNAINLLYEGVFTENPIHSDDIAEEFKQSFKTFLLDHKMSRLSGIDAFPRLDVIHGCTQFIDDIYQRVGTNGVQIFENDYKYHWRLNPSIKYATLEHLDPSKELIIAMPFPAAGDVHPDMQLILDRCYSLNIPVHLDGAWLTCSRDIEFDFNHPAIRTFAVSLSKGGLGTDRIGVRFSRDTPEGAISIMNDYNMSPKGMMHLGMKFMSQLGAEYFWRKYEQKYAKVCEDFNLQPTKAIHVAKTADGNIVGVRPLLRCQI